MLRLSRRNKRAAGARYETQARRYLEAQGLTYIAANVSCRQGELDLVMRDGGTLVFIEVRYRASERFGGAAASVDRRKQARLLAAAGYYLSRHPTDLPCRFDVVAMDANGITQWIRHAFDGAFA
ncbi:YraN family protein [Thiohalocapsa sp.]|uniref:YraN family protein n=1 Tax=Thiohalocapsa sp. TaxID=2497641 RepID=UPI0025DB9C95|nr:YraN family protein [Thiohalocapsa sp.]